MEKTYSLRRRLFVSATILLIVFLGLMGLFLNNAFKKSVLNNAESALKHQVLLLISAIEVVDGRVKMPAVLPESRLSKIDSTLFAQVSDANGKAVWRSTSLLEESLPQQASRMGEFSFIERMNWSRGHATYGMNFGLEWETPQGDLPLTIQAAENNAVYIERLKRYQQQLLLWLLSLGVILLVLQLTLLNWALKPLARVTKQVAEIENGERASFDENYPQEVSRLTYGLNQLLSFEEKQIKRHKEVLGNLAHSLKTPLAVLNGIDFSKKNKQEVGHQLGAMQDIIEYQLQSASAVGRRRFVKAINISRATKQTVNSLSKLYKDKNITIKLNMDDKVLFYGDQGDYMEVLGNLLENACKWARNEVIVDLKAIDSSAQSYQRKAIKLTVRDNGKGIADDLKQSILERGVRLDSQTKGHGLGLSIVKNIVDAYEGQMTITDNRPVGAIFEVVM